MKPFYVSSPVAILRSMKWVYPWCHTPNGTPDDAIAQELRSELCPSHVLYGIPVRQIGHRVDCDDALFELLDSSNRLAVVHLTFAQHPEPDPKWPETRLFTNWEQFEREEMLAE